MGSSLNVSASHMPAIKSFSRADDAVTIEHNDESEMASSSLLTTLSEMLSTGDAWKAFFSDADSSNRRSNGARPALVSVSMEPVFATTCGKACAQYTSMQTEAFGFKGSVDSDLRSMLPDVNVAEINVALEATAAAGIGLFRS